MRPGSTLTIGRLIGATVLDAGGRRLGTVVDLGITGLPEPEVVQLILGPMALAGRLQVAAPPSLRAPDRPGVRTIPWAEVEELQGRVLKLRSP